jgi:RIO-like serine/threonine protein kinase
VTPTGLPEDVRRFLKEHIRSVAELEVLLLLHRHHDRWWTPETVNEELRMSLQSAQDCLGHLHAVKVIERNQDDANAFRLDPARAGSDALIGQLGEHFRLRVSSVIDAIYSSKRDTMREFADAFRLIKKKDEDDG